MGSYMRFLSVAFCDVHYSGIVKYTGNGPENKGCVQSFGVMSSQVVSSQVVSCRHRPCGCWLISHGLLVKLSRPLGTSVENALCLPSSLTGGCWARGASCMISSPHTGFVGSRFGCECV